MKKFVFVLVLIILTSIISGCGLIDRMAKVIQEEQVGNLMQEQLERDKQSLDAFDKIFNGDGTSRMKILHEGKSYDIIVDDNSIFDLPSDKMMEHYAYAFSDITIENKIIYNQHDLIVTTTGLDLTHTSGPALNIRIQNNSKTDYSLVTKYTSINDVMINTNFSVDIPSKSDINSRISFSHHELRKPKITILSKIEFSFNLSSPSSDEFTLSDPITILTSDDSDLRHSFEERGLRLTDNNSLTIIVQDVKYTPETDSVDIDFFFENHLPYNIKIIPIEVLVNNLGVEPKPLFSSEIAANKRTIDTISLAGEDLDALGITSLKDFSFKFRAEDAQTGEEVLTLNVLFDI